MKIEIERIEDVRGSKRDYIIERAKKLMAGIEGSTDSREISNTIKDSARMSEVSEYGKEKLPCGDLSGNEVIVVEGRADVLNMIRNRVKNVIAMNGTKLPEDVRELSKEKEITLFLDGDRGGNLIAQNVTSNADVKYIAMAPDGKEVEELTGKEILMALRKKVSVDEYFKKQTRRGSAHFNSRDSKQDAKEEIKSVEFDKDSEKKIKEIAKENSGSGKAILLNENLEKIKEVSVKGLGVALKRGAEKPSAIVIDGAVTSTIIKNSEELGVAIIVAKNFSATSDKIKMLSL